MTQSPLFSQPIIRSGVDRASRVAVCIEAFCVTKEGNSYCVGSGTGFIHSRAGCDFLITNWHVITGRNPENPSELLAGYPDSPSSLQIYLPLSSNPNHFLPLGPKSLYSSDGKATWIETRIPMGGDHRRVDLVALPAAFPDTALVTRIEEFSELKGQTLRAGRDVVIVGYPFGIRAENPFPIWKRGSVASEPSTLIGGLPKYYIDSPGRPGMSGSPVFMISRGMGVSKRTHDLLDRPGAGLEALLQVDAEELRSAPEVNMMQFAGVYSGSVGDGSVANLNVGVAWHAALVDRLFSEPVEGTNPFPPHA